MSYFWLTGRKTMTQSSEKCRTSEVIFISNRASYQFANRQSSEHYNGCYGYATQLDNAFGTLFEICRPSKKNKDKRHDES